MLVLISVVLTMETDGLISNKIYFLLCEKRYINLNLWIYVSSFNF